MAYQTGLGDSFDNGLNRTVQNQIDQRNYDQGVGKPGAPGALPLAPGTPNVGPKNNDPRFLWNGSQTGAYDTSNRLQGLGSVVAGQQGPQADLTNYSQGRGVAQGYLGQENQSLGMLAAMANGTGPSAARTQLGQGLDQGLSQQLAVAASARGGGANIAAAQRGAAANSAGLAAQTNQAAGLARANEQMSAIAQYQNALVQRRAQNLQQQGLDAQTAMQQAQLESQWGMQGRSLQQQYEGMALTPEQAQMQAQMQLASIQNDAWKAQNQISEQSAYMPASLGASVIGAGAGAAASYYGGKKGG